MVHNYCIREFNRFDKSMEAWVEVESGILDIKEAKKCFRDYCESDPEGHYVLVRETIVEEYEGEEL